MIYWGVHFARSEHFGEGQSIKYAGRVNHGPNRPTGGSHADKLDPARISHRSERRLRGRDNARGQGRRVEALAEILRVMTAPTMAEPGVKLFLSYRSPTNKSLFFVFELYVNEAAWGAHEATDHFKIAVKELLPRVTRRERVPFVPFLKARQSRA